MTKFSKADTYQRQMESEESLIWEEIKKSASSITRAGGNTITLLLWSKGRTLMEVQRRISFIVTTQNTDENTLLRMEAICPRTG